MLWLILRVLARGAPVILYDLENGLRTVAERLRAMGADPDRIDDLLHYYPHTSLPAGGRPGNVRGETGPD